MQCFRYANDSNLIFNIFKSEEELKKLSLEEDLSEIQKVKLLLGKKNMT